MPLRDGGQSEITAWLAPGKNNIPMQSITKTTGARGGVVTRTATFDKIKRIPPPKSLFEVPSGYKEYNNLMELVREGQGGQRLQKAREKRKGRRQQR